MEDGEMGDVEMKNDEMKDSEIKGSERKGRNTGEPVKRRSYGAQVTREL